MSANHDIIAKNIVKYRMMNNLSQKEFANALKITPNALSAIERGKKKAGVNRLLQMADILNISLDTLLEGNLKYVLSNSAPKSENDKWFVDKLQVLSLKQKELYSELLDSYICEVKK